MSQDAKPLSAEEIARELHDAYERLAPNFGYTTRADTRVFDPKSPNGQLMQAVVTLVIVPRLAVIEQTENMRPQTSVEIEARKALRCLYVELDASVAADVSTKVLAWTDRQANKLEAARKVLEEIAAWTPPRTQCKAPSQYGCPSVPHTHPMGYEIGSNGERDYFRSVARKALAALAEGDAQ